MATTTYKIDVNSSNAIAALNGLQSKLKSTSDTFSKLGGAVAALGMVAAVKSVVGFADKIQDLADTTGIAIKNIVAFTNVVGLAGGSSEIASAALLKLTKNIGEAADGSVGLQAAFADVGITLNDLATLSETDILGKTIYGLDKLTDASHRSSVAATLLGKSFQQVGINGVAQGYDAAVIASAKYEISVKAAAAVQDKLDVTFQNVRMSILKAIEPMALWLSKLDQVKIDGFISKLLVLITTLGTLYTTTKLLTTVISLWTGAAALGASATIGLTTGVAGVGVAAASLSKTFTWLLSSLKGILAGIIPLGVASSVLGTRFAFLGAGISGLSGALGVLLLALGKFMLVAVAVAAAAYAIGTALDLAFDWKIVDTVTAKVKNLWGGLKDLLGIQSDVIDATKKSAEEIAEEAEAIRLSNEQMEKETAHLREVKNALDSKVATIRESTRAYEDANQQIIDSIKLQGESLGKTQQWIDTQAAVADIAGKTQAALAKLTQAKMAMSADEKKMGLGDIIDEEIIKIKELARVDEERVRVSLKGLESLRQKENLRLFQLSRQGDLLNKLSDYQQEIATVGLTAQEKKYADIKYQQEKISEEAIRQEQIRRGSKLTEAELLAYRQEAIDATGKLINKEQELYDKGRTGMAGLSKAWNEYLENARDASTQSANLFNNVMKGMEDIIVNFVKTGKLEWKSLFASLAEEILRNKIKESFATLMDELSGGDGVIGKIGSALGLTGMSSGGAKGASASNPMYVYDVSSGAGGIAKSIGNAASSMAGGDGGGNIVSTLVNKAAEYVAPVTKVVGQLWDWGKSLFGYANGGQVVGGKTILVGEKGPEMFTPGTSGYITPNSDLNAQGSSGQGGGSTTVIYNINAVDARSFQQLLASDPAILYQLTEQGRKSFGGRR